MQVSGQSGPSLPNKAVGAGLMALGVVLTLFYGAMLLPVAVNLPESWPGLVYAAVGIAGGVSCFLYVIHHRRSLLVPIVAAVLTSLAWLGAIVIVGGAIDRDLQNKRGAYGTTHAG
jgi:hypothetical protein